MFNAIIKVGLWTRDYIKECLNFWGHFCNFIYTTMILNSRSLQALSVLIFFSAVCASVIPSLFLINPISNDVFGLGLSSISYMWLGVMVVRVLSTFLL